MMKRWYYITYSPFYVGDSGKTDRVMIWATSIGEAIKDFVKNGIDHGGSTGIVYYTEYAIVKIEVQQDRKQLAEKYV